MANTMILQIISDGVFVVDLVTDDIEVIKEAVTGFEYVHGEMISGRSNDE